MIKKCSTFELRCKICNRKIGMTKINVPITVDNPNEVGKRFRSITDIKSNGNHMKILCSRCYNTMEEEVE